MTKTRILYRKEGFTLIELMVVVVIIAVISGLIIPKLLSFYDKKEKWLPEISEPGDKERTPTPVAEGTTPVIESAHMKLRLTSTYHRIGLEVYTRYEANCQGRIVFRRASGDERPVLLTIPLPGGLAEARDVRLILTRVSDGATWEPDNLDYRGQRLYWSGRLAKDEQLIAEVNFVTLGRETFEYRLPPARQLRSLNIELELAGGGTPKIPNHALQPTQITDQRIDWKFNNLVTDRTIILEIPGALSPLGRVLLLVRLLAIAVLLFGIGLWYLSEQWQPGLLENFRWGHFLLLALTYSLYFIIFAVISFQEHVSTWVAMLVSALFSWPLLLFHVTRTTGFNFALRRVLPLSIFTLGVVINGVYGGPIREYVFIVAVIAIIAYLTFTYEKWEKARSAYREKQRTAYAKEISALRKALLKDAGRILEEIQAADIQADHVLESSSKPETAAERYKLIQKRKGIDEFGNTYTELKERLPEVEQPSNEFLEFQKKQNAALKKDIEEFSRETQEALDEIQRLIEALEQKKRTVKSRHDKQRVYCIACGKNVPPSPYCPECGTKSGTTLICSTCRQKILLPLHLFAEEKESAPLYCLQCGEGYRK